MAGSFGEGPSTRSKRGMYTLRQSSAQHTFDRKDLRKDDFEKRAVMYEDHIDVDDLNNHFNGFHGFVDAQSWEIALMQALEKKVALPQIRKFYYTLTKMNEGYYKAKVNRQEFNLRLVHIVQLLKILLCIFYFYA